jgi:hypothetical protein
MAVVIVATTAATAAVSAAGRGGRSAAASGLAGGCQGRVCGTPQVACIDAQSEGDSDDPQRKETDQQGVLDQILSVSLAPQLPRDFTQPISHAFSL